MPHSHSTNGYANVNNAPRHSRDHEDRLNQGDYDAQVHIASEAEKRRLWWRNALMNALFIASWFLFATLLSVYNKWMFSEDHFNFPYPFFVTTLHMLIQFSLAATLRFTFPQHFRPKRSPSRPDYIRKAVPTGITTALDVGSSNVSLKYITLSFYTMCKSSSLIFVLFFAFLFKLETFSLRLVGVIALIFLGVVLMVATETHFILSGFLLVISASALGGLRWSLTQLLLRNKNMGLNHPVATLFWLSPIMAVTLGIISMLVDGWIEVFSSHFFVGDAWQLVKTGFFLISPGVLAFCMVLSEYYILQRAGVVPMSIAGIAKEVTTISISAWFFGDQLTPLNITGVAITACGICLFTYHKYRKSIEATVPLDGHGNPITDEDEDEDVAGGLVALHGGPGIDLEERQRLTDAPEPRASQEYDTPVATAPQQPQELLFDVGSDDELEDASSHLASRQRHSGAPPPHADESSDDLQNAWRDAPRTGDA
ncbi:TPT-domain-containing protein [Obba rivulosa]|uniref:TPT-domain-containing protein n=1 Tax=Obba rivulosa TaxID=1052685 RepID=A0A8E2B0J2_9APHY|nr:TPT-domain-containing protein [Obba rivulosa]